MNSLTVWKFNSPDRAEQALGKLKDLARQRLIVVEDAAIVSWPEGRKKPKTRELGNLTGAGALWGGFWGLLFGLIFLVPVLGLALGAAGGALASKLGDYGITDQFMDEVREKVTPGTSALFVVSRDEVLERIAEQIERRDFELIRSNLTAEQERKLREELGDEEQPTVA